MQNVFAKYGKRFYKIMKNVLMFQVLQSPHRQQRDRRHENLDSAQTSPFQRDRRLCRVNRQGMTQKFASFCHVFSQLRNTWFNASIL